VGLENSIYRDQRVERALRKNNGNVAIEVVKTALSDHLGYPYSVCRHPEDGKPDYDQWRTNVSVIMDLDAREFWLADGPPCETQYVSHTL
jgi:isopenicillin-N N-acyltransferase-like protein